ncbi:MAG: NTP/NDP exchange transporter [Vicinamibacterales bacterium]
MPVELTVDAPRLPATGANTHAQRLRQLLGAVVGDVRPGELGLVASMLASLFLLLTAYYVLKTVREPLVLASGSAELKSYAAAGQAVALLAYVPAYSWLAARVQRRTLITWLLALFTLQIELFAIALGTSVAFLGFAFYVWVGLFSLATIAQFWSYAADVLSRDVGERLFPVIAIGATVGSPVGALLAQSLFSAGVPMPVMLHLAAAVVVVHLAFYWLTERSLSATPAPSVAASNEPRPRGGFALVWSSPYLRWLAAFLLLLNVANTLGEYIISRSVLDRAADAVARGDARTVAAYVGAFYGSYFFWVNTLAVVLQIGVASRLVKRAGAAGVVLALPIIALGVYGLVAAGVAFAALRWAKTLENATDYSLMNTGRQLLWLPTSRNEKYAAKQAIDTFVVRSGDLVAAGVVALVATRWQFDVQEVARVNLGVVAVWLVVGLIAVRAYRRLCRDCP